MASSVINGAIGKSPLIDKINQLAAKEVKIKAAAQLEQQVCGRNTAKNPSVPISFPKCRQEIKRQLTELWKERQDGKADV